MRRILHISDLHFGRVDSEVVSTLVDAVRKMRPDLIVVSGDLTQRARNKQFRAAKEFLEALPQPQLIVPGNHDIPLFNPVMRFFRPFARYRRWISSNLEPVFRDDEIAVFGVATAKKNKHSRGAIHGEQLLWIRSQLLKLPSTVTKILVTHHPTQELCVDELFHMGLDILLSGHSHSTRSDVSSVHLPFQHRSALLVEAGTATSTRLRAETNSFNVLTVDEGKVSVAPFQWEEAEGDFVSRPAREFRLLETGWAS